MFVSHLLTFFSLVKLKLKNEGSLWINIGDSYGTQSGTMLTGKMPENGTHKLDYEWLTGPMIKGKSKWIKHKCLLLIPQRFAIGMIDNGWICRSEVIWAKWRPESVKDRFNDCQEKLYHFVKQEKYYFDLDSIRETIQTDTIERYKRAVRLGAYSTQGKINVRNEENLGFPKNPPKWFMKGENSNMFGSPRARAKIKDTKYNNTGNINASNLTDSKDNCRISGIQEGNPLGRNPGNVWFINTEPYSGSHYASFPVELVKRPILATCPEEVCIKCDKAKRKIIKTGENLDAFNIRVHDVKEGHLKHMDRVASDKEISEYNEQKYISEEKEYVISKGCNCNTEYKPGIVLDPFSGSGVTGRFCRYNNRDCILFELNPDYLKLIEDRCMLKTHDLSKWTTE